MAVVGEDGLQAKDKEIIEDILALRIPLAVAFNKKDISAPAEADLSWLRAKNVPFEVVSAAAHDNLDALKNLIISLVPEDQKKEPLLAGDLFETKDIVLLVVPIDLSAPKGRLILPQVQVLREILDKGAKAIAVKESELSEMLSQLKTKPALVITDSQVVMKVAPIVPLDIPLTTFSILFARNKGDLPTMFAGAQMIDALKDGDKILIAEACSHHPIGEDIGTVKIPNWLRRRCSPDLVIEHAQGHDFPKDLSGYDLVIHCGGCTFNRREMLSRILQCTEQGVPFTNYGVAIAYCFGILERALRPFPEALAAYERTVRR